MAEDLVRWNLEVEETKSLKEYLHIMDLFLWDSDPYEPFHPDVLFNRTHLLGMLICRACRGALGKTSSSTAHSERGALGKTSSSTAHSERGALRKTSSSTAHSERGALGKPSSSTTHSEKMDKLKVVDLDPLNMTLKQLKDTLFNLQIEWPVFLEKDMKLVVKESKIEAIRQYLHRCMARIGDFLVLPQEDSVLNDVQDTCDYLQGHASNSRQISKSLKTLTPAAIRRLLASILMLYRHIDLYDLCEELPEAPADFLSQVTPYHHEASLEQFHKNYMHWMLPVAAKMQYKHDFFGMYNDVSQVVYFHDAQFQRINREPYTSSSPIHMLASICLLYPEVPVMYEDSHFSPSKSHPQHPWYWLLLPHRIYLVSPEPKVYYSKDLNSLVRVYKNWFDQQEA